MICNMCPRHESCADAKNGCENCDIGQALKIERKNFLRQKIIVKNLLEEIAPGCEPEALEENLQKSEAIEIIDKAVENIINSFCKGEPKFSVMSKAPFTEYTYTVGNLFNSKKKMLLTVSFIPCKK